MRLERLDLAAHPARGMKLVATGMLVVMACVFVAAGAGADEYPWLGYVQAFAEAAMVGGLADWFAVTALFRHPLGLPIPHTAIIPKNKDRIGDNLASFLKSNFLTPSIVARRLERFDMAGSIGRWLAAPRAGGKAKGGAGRLVAQLVTALDNEAIGGLMRNAVSSRVRAMEVSPLLGSALDTAIEGNRHEPLIDSGFRWAANAVLENGDELSMIVSRETPKIARFLGVDDWAANKLMVGLIDFLSDVAENPHHSFRRAITKRLRDLAFDLKHMPETREKVEAMKNELLDQPQVGDYLEGIWDGLKRSILRATSDPDAALSGRLGEAAKRLGETLESDPKLRAAVNKYIRRAVVGLVADYGDEIVKLVSDTIRNWDANTVTEKIEIAVGRDLQYIRINGTLIGGLVGLVIHAASEAI